MLLGPGCAHPALALRAHTKTNSSYPEIPQSFAQKTHFEVFSPPLSFVALRCWSLSMTSQTITELGMKSFGRNKKKNLNVQIKFVVNGVTTALGVDLAGLSPQEQRDACREPGAHPLWLRPRC